MNAVDLFSGAGGFSEGARLAGVHVVAAADHWPAAVACHTANHPETVHYCQDLHQIDWSQIPAHDLLLASPACQGHSRARGKDRAHHDGSRATAWAVVSCLEAHRPELGLIENVPEFLEWSLYPAWLLAVRLLGYSVSSHVINAADHGVPQARARVFLVLARSLAPLRLRLPQEAHVPVSSLIDWTGGTWSPVVRPRRAAATLRQWRAGRRERGERFLIPYYGSHRRDARTRSIDRPLGTVTTRARYAVVDGDRMRMLTVAENRAAMGFPDSYQLPTDRKLAIHLLGNAVCPPVARDLILAMRRAA